jgi:hypothetical protein
MEALLGFEPKIPDSKSDVLPLHYRANWQKERDSNPWYLSVHSLSRGKP